MNTKQILAKIKRNLDMLAIAYTSDSVSITVTASGSIVSTVDAPIAAPMGGVDGTVSPFLGIGTANPGSIKIKGGAGKNTIATILTTEADLIVMRQLTAFANDVVVEAGDTATQLARLPGDPDLRSLGQ